MTEEDNKTPRDAPKGYKRKKKVPPVSFLLKHGDPESEGKPKSWADEYVFPLFVLVAFILSFFVFQYVIENHTTHRPIKLPRVPRQMTAKAERKAMGEMPKKDSEEL